MPLSYPGSTCIYFSAKFPQKGAMTFDQIEAAGMYNFLHTRSKNTTDISGNTSPMTPILIPRVLVQASKNSLLVQIHHAQNGTKCTYPMQYTHRMPSSRQDLQIHDLLRSQGLISHDVKTFRPRHTVAQPSQYTVYFYWHRTIKEPWELSRYSAGLRAGRSGFDSRRVLGIFL
jgi:hypothetical protein